MIARRYAAVTACLIGLALVPTIGHTYLNIEVSDGRSVTAIPVKLAGMASASTAQSSAWVEETFSSRDWIERTYRARDGRRILLFAARTADAKKLYHHPELALLHGTNPHHLGIVRVPTRPEVPVHLIETRSREARGRGGYVLLSGTEFVTNPVAFQLRTAVGSMLARPLQMTLVFVHDPSAGSQPFEGSPASQLLLEAVRAFERQPEAGTD